MDVIHVNIYWLHFILHILSLYGIPNLEQSCGRNHTQNLCFHLHSIPSLRTMWHVSSPTCFDLNQCILTTVIHHCFSIFRLLAFFFFFNVTRILAYHAFKNYHYSCEKCQVHESSFWVKNGRAANILKNN